ncbi:MAG: pyruvate ferredoxin oxidoreductase [Lachnospiraceae bacterium]|nr:pyruvate ferredoxin oxidoreductase [Lachnospiraceae bacterium]MDD7178742.1 transketolase C-terminal domain-containing protein [bacterium]MDY5517340.1 transketolase C-terminal domain-containing protein [Lachnospiraceae bacterium]
MLKTRMSGNEAVAHAIKQINPDVMPAFPITPSTEIPQFVATMIANGEIDTEFIPVESEHSSMSAAIGSSAAGARTLTATSSCGLAFMWEVLYVAASNRLPIAMAVVNRGLTGPLNINAEHSDSMGARDSGWLQIYAENNQEVYDNFLQAYRIAEHPDVKLPIMICQDGFITSHAVENITLWDDDKMKKFVGEYEPEHYLLKEDEVMAVGPYAASGYCMEAKKAQAEAMKRAKKVILDVAKEFEAITGQSYGFFEGYRLDDAEYAIVAIGSVCGTAKDAVDAMREKGLRAGLLKIRVFRPFPAEEIADALKNCRAIAIMDRSEGYNAVGGPLGAEVTAALYRAKSQAEVVNIMYGLSGRDVRVEDLEQLFDNLVKLGDGEKVYDEMCPYLGLRE